MANNKFKIYENLALITQIGLIMIVPILLSIFIGKFIDDKLGTGNIFLFIFIIIGVSASFINLYKVAMRGYNKRK